MWMKEDYEVLGAAVNKAKTYTDGEIAKVRTKFQVVASYNDLPNPGRTDTIYLVPQTGHAGIYDQYIYENNQYVDIGDTELDLAEYVTESELETALSPIVDITGNFVVENGKLCIIVSDENNQNETTNEPLATDATLQAIAESLQDIADTVEEVAESTTENWMDEHFANHPTTDGTYVLQCTVSSGVATYNWVSVS